MLARLSYLNSLKAFLFEVKNLDKKFLDLAIRIEKTLNTTIKSSIMIILNDYKELLATLLFGTKINF